MSGVPPSGGPGRQGRADQGLRWLLELLHCERVSQRIWSTLGEVGLEEHVLGCWLGVLLKKGGLQGPLDSLFIPWVTPAEGLNQSWGWLQLGGL